MKRALVLSLAVVLGLGVASFAQTLTGTWDTTITITPSPVINIGISSTLTVTYSLSGWAFTSKTVVNETGWLDQMFTANGALGAFTLGSTLDFAPATALFEKWTVTGGLSIAGVAFSGVFTLYPNDVKFVVTGSGTAGLVTVKADITFGVVTYKAATATAAGVAGNGCDLDWAGISISASFPFCCADVSATLTFDCLGFQKVCFDVKNIVIPGIAWAVIDAKLCFETQTKTLTLTPKFNFGGTGCFDIYLSSPSGGKLFGDITVDGIGLTCTIGGVQFTGISYMGGGILGSDGLLHKPGLLDGTPYWEAYQIKTTDDGCCGPFAFDIAVYFKTNGVRLFDVSKFVANMSIQLATQFTFKMGLSLDVETSPSFTNWSLGFIVKW